MKILVVDDDAELRGLVKFALRQEGHDAVEASDGREALEVFSRERPDLVILDVNMPVMNGFEALREIRARSDAPVMMLTVRSGEADQVRGLDLGADDYLTKPFSPRALLARVRALGRRTSAAQAGVVECGDFAVDPDNRTVRLRGGDCVRLTVLEFRLLQFLMTQPGRAATPEKLVRQIWGWQGIGDRTRLKQLIRRLRLKIEPTPGEARYLVTTPGLGYVFRPRVEGAGETERSGPEEE